LERDTVDYHNQLRTNPQSFIPILEEMITRFDPERPLLYQTEKENIKLKTREGANALKYAIAFLKD
jgi:hypothetical protein